ncbi:hypothetical protein ASF49_21720 [Methylobacterium sp. Leaf104]|uniref:hypothetical protein n=1 Tax=Methylobacterium TaxID=407 RepID=UPI0006FC6FEC|nr:MULTISPECIES: hypothetical protein [Methylobacterium]KQP39287.1 hypothetical protein ASF49_21720 [Methylobacterium sp. Leaf104]MCI9882827.1 hypothetical protein [Methylobacterium goesingense]
MSPPDAPRRASLALVPAILAGLILRRTGAVPPAPGTPAEASRAEDWDYERTDAEAGKTAWVMLGLAGAVLATIGAVLALNHVVLGRQRAALPPLTAQQTAAIRPPPPNLQPDPYAEIDARHAEAAGRLSGYAFLDADRTRARIPIDRAMALMAGRPFDVETAAEPREAASP